MINAQQFIDQASLMGYTFFTGTPCSYLKPFINKVIDNGKEGNSKLEYIPANNEGDAVALAAGAYLGGKKTVVMFQNSGLGNAVNALTSLNYIFRIPTLGIVTLRGEVNGDKDEPQHELMGKITTNLLDQMEIPWSYFPIAENEILPKLNAAQNYMEEFHKPYFFVMKKNSVSAYELKTDEKINEELLSRTQALELIKKYTPENTAYIATTGKTNREFFELGDSKKNIYMVGSMGCAISMGIGLALSKKDSNKLICVIDGDGALMMRMGNMSMVGILKPQKLLHILLDNGQHDSTGGQQTSSHEIAFEQIARGCGYEHVFVVHNEEELKKSLAHIPTSNCFIRFMIKPGGPKSLGRPSVAPYVVAQRFKDSMNEIN